jgi:hypothetical protein
MHLQSLCCSEIILANTVGVSLLHTSSDCGKVKGEQVSVLTGSEWDSLGLTLQLHLNPLVHAVWELSPLSLEVLV